MEVSQEEIARQKAALDLAVQYANNTHETKSFIEFYNKMDPKVYEDMSQITEFSDEQEALAKAVYMSQEEGGLATPKDAAILDVACGTGMFARLLQNEGYTNMVGSDATPNFCKVSRETGIYTEVFEQWFGMGVEKFPTEHKDRYDVVTASGCLSKGHIPNSGLDDIHAALKVGGYMVTAFRTFYLVLGEENGFREKLDAMEQDGKFKLIKSQDFMRGLTGKTIAEQVKKECEEGIKRFAAASSTLVIY